MEDLQQIEREIIKLRQLKNHYDLIYWINSDEAIDDKEYLPIVERFNNLLKKYPQFKLSEDDKLELGKNLLTPVRHKYKLYSLDKVLSNDEFMTWLNKKQKEIAKLLNSSALTLSFLIDYILEGKIDGLTADIRYEDGLLVNMSSRGQDGIIGDDITTLAFKIKDIPKKLENHFTGNVIGEIYMKKSSLIKLNKYLESINKKPLKNVRNAASGLTKRKDTKYAEYLSFIVHGAHLETINNKLINNETYLEDIDLLKKLGFITVYHDLNGCKLDIKTNDNIINKFKEFEDKRDSLDLDIDGLVIKINQKNIQEKLGVQNRFPNWGVALKMTPRMALSKLLDVEFEYGRKSGIFTPMLVIEPVEIGGTTVKRPTGHNLDELKKLDLKIGDTVKVQRKGDVIPKVVGIVEELRTGNEKEIKILTHCPICNEPLKIDGAFLKCVNEDCDGRISGKIKNFVKVMEIKTLGENIIEKLIDNDLITNILDLYNLKVENIAELERMGEKSAKKIVTNIEKTKVSSIEKIIQSLTIKNIGERASKDLAKKYTTLNTFRNAKYNELINLPDFGPTTCDNIINWLSKQENQYIIDELIKLGMGIEEKKEELKSNKLQGKKIAFTGALSKSRKQVEKDIIDNGGEVCSISKGITHLLVGEGAKEAKQKKAELLGAEIITEQQFLEMIK